MSEMTVSQDSLVLYKNKVGRILQVGKKKVEIELLDGKTLKGHPKAITLLHPGPISSLKELQPQEGELLEAWDLLAGETTNLVELSELAYGEYTPATAWCAWQLVDDGLYFSGSPDKITVHEPESVDRKKALREAKAARKQAWQACLKRLEGGKFIAEDAKFLEEVADFALGKHYQSRVLQALNHSESPQNAHAFLLSIGYWDEMVNPYPSREGAPIEPPQMILPDLAQEERRDLTHLPAFAIDDEGSKDPDDALSLDNGRLWVHIADVAALIGVDSPADLEARARGANLYLPEGTIHMLPPKATDLLALGLQDISPALSFALEINNDAKVRCVEIVPSWVRVTRLTYLEAEGQLDLSPLKEMYQLSQIYQSHREENDAIDIDLPEVRIRVEEGKVIIRPLLKLRSRDLVREAMLMTGEAVARFALEREIPLPFTSQDPPESDDYHTARTPSEMFAVRRSLKRSQQKSTPGRHAGLGMDLYVQSTSPLRRYLDMVVHQQLRAYLRGDKLLDSSELMQRVGAASAIRGSIRWAERLSNQHWTLVYLQQHPNWRGKGVIIDKRGRRDLILLPDLDYEILKYLPDDLPLDSVMTLELNNIDLANQTAHFKIV